MRTKNKNSRKKKRNRKSHSLKRILMMTLINPNPKEMISTNLPIKRGTRWASITLKWQENLLMFQKK